MPQYYEIVGGVGLGGIIVREGKDLKSPECKERISTGALVEEIELIGARLHYKLCEGTGPAEGWISLKLKDKDLVVTTDRKPGAGATNGASNGGAKEPCALLFPGQGSQYVGMLKEMKDEPAVKDMLEKSKEILGWDVLDLCLNGPEEKLENTQYTQPAMFIGGLAGVEKLRKDKPECANNPTFLAGLSLGEYTALCVAGVFSFEDGLKLVKIRGEAMQEAATTQGKQAMLSVAGLDRAQLDKLCEESKKEEGPTATCQVANALFPNGFAAGGSEKAINICKEKCEKAGALQAKILKTGGAFHTALMQPAQVKLNEALDAAVEKMTPPKFTIYMNATSEPVAAGGSVSTIVENLKKQLTNPVLWEPSCQKMIKAGITEYYECGPMKQLKAMMKRIDQKVWKTTYNIDV
jgi:[acyl-carrier-protein] S-malonyltransferase